MKKLLVALCIVGLTLGCDAEPVSDAEREALQSEKAAARAQERKATDQQYYEERLHYVDKGGARCFIIHMSATGVSIDCLPLVDVRQ